MQRNLLLVMAVFTGTLLLAGDRLRVVAPLLTLAKIEILVTAPSYSPEFR